MGEIFEARELALRARALSWGDYLPSSTPPPLSHRLYTEYVMLTDQPRNTCTHDYKRSVILISDYLIIWVIMGSILTTHTIVRPYNWTELPVP